MTAYSVERTRDGSLTLRSTVLDQACHSSCGAWLEARERYADPCELRMRAAKTECLRILDVGTGPGWNVAALLEATLGGSARIEVVSLELEPEVFALGEACVAGDESGGGRWLALARKSLAESARLGGAFAPWPGDRPAGGTRLLFGDACATLPALPESDRFDAVFLDPFSPARAPELWQPEFLAEIARRMNPGALLSTYTTSLRVRVSLRAAGLAVGPGPRVGEKHQGTLASPDRQLEPFDARTTRKLEKRVARQAEVPVRESGA